MKRLTYIFVGLLSVAAVSCVKTVDNSEFDQLLSKDYNQVIKWDVDSLALNRADWKATEYEGATLRKADFTIWDEQHSVSYLEYNANAFATLLAFSAEAKTLPELVDGGDALFAINGAPCTAGGPATFTMFEKNVVKNSNDPALDGINGLITIRKTASYETSVSLFEGLNYSSIYNGEDGFMHALATGPVLVKGGEVQDVPTAGDAGEKMTRSILGITAGGSNRFITIDSVTLKEAATIVGYMGLRTAVAMASGPASTIWTKEGGVVAGSGSEKMNTALYVVANKLFEGGDGSASAPYQIADISQMLNMPSALVDGKTVFFELINDIDMTGVEWAPLNAESPYSKAVSFDGRGHTISNFTIKHAVTIYPSFFGVLNGTCCNVRFVNVDIDSPNTSNTGAIAGYAGASTDGVSCVIENVYVEGKLNMSGSNNIGGIAGASHKATITNCYANVTVTKAGTTNGAGGLVGLSNHTTRITNCYVRGKVDAACERVGGIAGTNNAEECYIFGCISWLDEIKGGNRVGAIAGYAGAHDQHGHKIGDCFYWKNLKMYDTQGLIDSFGDKDTNRNDSKPRYNGQPADNIITTAQSLNWDANVWDFSGAYPEIKWSSFN